MRGSSGKRVRVGIPKALLYYEYSAFWHTFLENLDVEIITSVTTNPEILESGVKLAVDEACLPVKVLCGHVEHLASRVDWLFVPRIVSVAPREYTCPKMLGLPEMLTLQLEPHTCRVLTATVNLYREARDLIEPCAEIAAQLGRNRIQAMRALAKALISHRKSEQSLYRPREHDHGKVQIGVLGHRYLIDDDGVNLGVIRHLNRMGVSPVIADHAVTHNASDREARALPKPLFWTYEKRVLGVAYHLIRHRLVDGLVQMVSFGCGPDSMVASLIESRAHEEGMPYLLLSVDEHSGEAGTVTRLEAFVDMLLWRAEKV